MPHELMPSSGVLGRHDGSGSPAPTSLCYAPQDAFAPKRRATAAQRRVGCQIAIGVLTLMVAAVWILYFGDNRWRVRFHHGVRLPASAREIHCWGTTAF